MCAHSSLPLCLCVSAEATDSVRLSEIYGKLDEIEADKAPARYLWQPGTEPVRRPCLCLLTDLCLLQSEPLSSSPGLDSLPECNSRPQSEFSHTHTRTDGGGGAACVWWVVLKPAPVSDQGVLRRMEDEAGLGQSFVCSVSFSVCSPQRWRSHTHARHSRHCCHWLLLFSGPICCSWMVSGALCAPALQERWSKPRTLSRRVEEF